MEKNEFWSSTRISLGPLLFLVYINDLPDGLTLICKIFADDTSLFSNVFKRNEFNIALEKISQWAYQWCNNLIGLMKRLSINLPRNALLTIYKSFIRPHLDYGDILYDNPNNENFQSKLQKVQYRACLAITSAIKGTSRE